MRRIAFVSFANRGRGFEEEIEKTNEYYARHSVALVHKRPTPIHVVRMDRTKNKIIEAYFHKKSTVDYEGVSGGIHLEFDVKECRLSTRFPLKNLGDHQVHHLLQVEEHGGVGFFLIKFVLGQQVYLVRIRQVLDFVEERQSIPRDWFSSEAWPVPPLQGWGWDYILAMQKSLS